jgi:predicted nucleic acid-binding protein
MRGKSLVTCPLSELGFLRISTGRVFGSSMGDSRQALISFIQTNNVEFLPADLPAIGSHPSSSAEVTDIYLAELAQKHGMKLATLDAGIVHPAVVGI